MLSKLGIEENFLKVIKNTYKKSTANIILNAKKLNAFPLEIGNKVRISTLATSAQHRIIYPCQYSKVINK